MGIDAIKAAHEQRKASRAKSNPAPDVNTVGAYAIRVRHPSHIHRLIIEEAETLGLRSLKSISQCSDSPSPWGRPPKTFATLTDAERERAAWERAYREFDYSFEVVERVLVPTWRAVGGDD
jgi:hypothetical protein